MLIFRIPHKKLSQEQMQRLYLQMPRCKLRKTLKCFAGVSIKTSQQVSILRDVINARLSLATTATAPRRKLIVYILLGLAITGAAIRVGTPQGSALHDIGTLMLVLWLPVIGNVVGFFGRKIRMPAPKLAFDHGSPFTAQLRIAFTPAVPPPAVTVATPGGMTDLFTLVIGREGFNARPAGTVAEHLAVDGALEIELEFLHPARAMHRFPVGTDFKLLVDTVAVGRGTVLAVVAATGSPVPAPRV